MPTPACLATAVIGAPGSATKTARAESRIRWSLRAASALRPLIGPGRLAPARAFVSVMKKSVAKAGTNHSVLLECGTEGFVPQAMATSRSDGGARRDRQREAHPMSAAPETTYKVRES